MSEHKIETKFGTYRAEVKRGKESRVGFNRLASFTYVDVYLESSIMGSVELTEWSTGTVEYEACAFPTKSPSELAATLAVLAAALELLEKERESMEKKSEEEVHD